MGTLKRLFDLTGRVAVVAGGAGLLGRGFGEILAEAGAGVVLADSDGARASEAALAIEEAHGRKTLGLQTDITDPASVDKLVASTMEAFGSIDVLVNSVALTAKGGSEKLRDYFAPFEDYPLELWELALQVNLTGMFLVTQACGRVMVKQRRGSVINISSTYGNVAPDQRIYEGITNPYNPNVPLNTPISYAVSKGAVLSFTRYLAAHWGPHNVRVNALSPGGVYDDHDEQFVRQYSARTILGRMAEQHEYKAAVLFLASDASSYMTGANLIVDGGWTAW